MNFEALHLEQEQVRKLLSAGSGDAALLYLYLRSGNSMENAAQLNIQKLGLATAAATLRQLGLLEEQKKFIPAGQRPSYTEKDVLTAEPDFLSLCDEIQRLLGRPINTEERKIILGFTRYLGLPGDVICVLVCYCKDRARQKGSLRNPSLRAIEKEAYAWAERGIDTLEEASAFIQRQNVRHSRLGKLMEILQIRGRSLTAGEEKYAQSWLDMGFDEEAIALAYERTCLNTGGLNWAYMNKILARWHQAGLHTVDTIRSGDRKPGAAPKAGQRELDADEIAAIQRMLQEV